MPAPRDITNKRFNNLVAIEKAPSRGGHTYWRFRCDCGKEKEIMTSNVIRGAIKSCGCHKAYAANNYFNVQHSDNNIRKCKICGAEFTGFQGDNRIFCYVCSPVSTPNVSATTARKRALKHVLVEYKGGKCAICGYNQCEGALQFHHLNASEKDFTLADIKPNKISIEELKAEADKCTLLCANCHSEQHEVIDKVGTVMRLPPKDLQSTESRICRICSTNFIPNNPNRYYCYNCVPWGVDLSTSKRIRKKSLKHMLIEYAGGKCQKCGYDNCDNALHFHHKNPEDKEFGIARARLDGEKFTIEKVLVEVDKCDLLCANCHAEEHYLNDTF